MNENGALLPQASGKVAIVDDDALFRELVTRNLTDSGFEVSGFDDGASMLSTHASGYDANVILLDWVMPEMTGIEVLRRLRAQECATPVIFLTMLTDQIYEEAALLGGAIDFVEKSRSFSILRKRIEVALSGAKTPGGGQERGASDSGIELIADSKRIAWKGRQIGLTLTEFNVVQHMIAHAGSDVSYRELYDIVHGEGFVSGYGEMGYRANVRALIKRVRQKFRDVDAEFDRIENYPGFGYRWRDDAAQ